MGGTILLGQEKSQSALSSIEFVENNNNLKTGLKQVYNSGSIDFLSGKVYKDELFDYISSDFTNQYQLITKRNNKKKNQVIERYQELYMGVPIEGRQLTVYYSLDDNSVVRVNTDFEIKKLDLDINPKIAKEGINNILDQSEVKSSQLKITDRFAGKYQLVWEVRYISNGSKIGWIDANKGVLLGQQAAYYNLNKDGPTEDYDVQPMSCVEDGPVNKLISDDNVVKTYDYDQASIWDVNIESYNSNLIPEIPTAQQAWSVNEADESVYQAHWMVNNVIQEYLSLGIEYKSVHVGSNCSPGASGANALALSGSTLDEAWILFSDNETAEASTLAEFDIVGHELAHVYLNEFLAYDSPGNGSLHEGISDMFGVYMEGVLSAGDWVIGDDVPITNRDLQNPNFTCFTDVENFFFGDCPYCQHNRSTPLGYWFYLLVEGSASNSNIVPIDIGQAIDVIIHSLEILNNRYADYPELRVATLSYLSSEYGYDSDIYKTVFTAWAEICVNIDIGGGACSNYIKPLFSDNFIVNECPETNVNMDNIHVGVVPNDAVLIYSTDDDPTDGVFPILSSITTVNDFYYAYYFNPSEGCYSEASDVIIVLVSGCCDEDTSDLIVTGAYTATEQESFGGNIIIQSGGEFIVSSGYNIYMGQDKLITVESGGKLTIQSNATIQPCLGADYWQGVKVDNQGDSNSSGNLVLANEGFSLNAGAHAHFYGGSISGVPQASGSFALNHEGIKTFGKVRMHVDGVSISNYSKAVDCTDSESFYYITNITAENVRGGIYLDRSPAYIADCTLTLTDNTFDAISVKSSAESTLYHNTCLGDIVVSSSAGVKVDHNTVGSIDKKADINIYDSYSGEVINNKIKGLSNGIRLQNTDFDCKGNEIETSSGSGSAYGAIVMAVTKGIEVFNNSIIGPNTNSGILDVWSSDSEIHNNAIYGSQNGILVLGSVFESIQDNIIDASSGDGIKVLNSPDSDFNCNSITSSNNAIEISANSEGQDFFHNYLAGNIDLEINSVIGVQGDPFLEIPRGNEFIGGRAISNLSSDDNDGSRFLINPELPYHRPDQIIPSEGWFKNDLRESFYLCLGNQGTTGFWTNEESNWDGMCSHYLHIRDTYGAKSLRMTLFLLNAKRVIDWSLSDFVSSCLGDPWPPHECANKIVEVETLILDGPTRSNIVENFNMDIKELEVGIVPTDIQIEKLASRALETQNKYDYDTKQYLRELAEAVRELERLDCQDNEVITVSTAILTEYVKFKRNTKVYDYNQMLPYARLCAKRYGRLVHLARVVVSGNNEEDFSKYDQCSLTEKRIDNRSILTAADIGTLYPNPSSGLFTIALKDRSTSHIVIKDIQGKILKQINVNGDHKIEVDLTGHLGVNFINLHQIDGTLQVLKAVVIQ